MSGRLLLIAACLQFGMLSGSRYASSAETLSPAEYFHLNQEAEAIHARRDYAAAADLYARLVEQNPTNGDLWLQLGRCQTGSKRHREAIASLKKATELGAGVPHLNARQIAANFASLGEHDEAYRWLDRAVELGLVERVFLRRDAAFDVLRDEERFQTLSALPGSAALSRDERWRADLAFLLSEAERLHPDLYRTHSPEELKTAVGKLDATIPDLSEAQIVVELQRVAAMFGDGHSLIRLYGRQVPLTQIPITLYDFSDGLFLIDAEEPYQEWIGARVVRFGELPAEQALDAIAPWVSRDNPQGIRANGPALLRLCEVLTAAGVASDPKSVTLTLERDGKEAPVKFTSKNYRPSSRFFPSRMSGAPEPPLYLRHADKSYWFEHLPDDAAIYLQFNSVSADPGESFEQFSQRLHEFYDQHDVKNLIVDVRLNGGGNTFLYQPLLRTIVHFEQDRPGRRVYVIAGRYTFSACQNFSTDLDRLTDAIFAGEPTGSSPSSIGESTPVVLPHSGLQASISTLRWQFTYPMDHRIWIPPQIPRELNSADYFANRDPVLEAVLAVIREEQPSTADSSQKTAQLP